MTGTKEFAPLLIAEIPTLRRFARKLTRDADRADDLLQDALLLAWKHRHRFEPGTNLKGWTGTILYNRFVETVRVRSKRPDGHVGFFEIGDAQTPVSGGQEAVVALREVFTFLETLPRDQQSALLSVGVFGFTGEEAAEEFGCEIGTVKSRASRAREELRQAMGAV